MSQVAREGCGRVQKQVLGTVEMDTLRHALDVADRTLRDSVKLWEKAEPNHLVSENGISGMRELFTDYVKRLGEFREKFEAADQVIFVTEEDDA